MDTRKNVDSDVRLLGRLGLSMAFFTPASTLALYLAYGQWSGPGMVWGGALLAGVITFGGLMALGLATIVRRAIGEQRKNPASAAVSLITE